MGVLPRGREVAQTVQSGRGMNKLLPLLALTAAGCGGANLPIVDVSLSELPNPSFYAELETEAGGEFTWVQPEQDAYQGPCHRLPGQTRLSANGREFKMESPGGSFPGTLQWRYATCRPPQFTSGTLPDEPRTEFILSDGQSQRRAVFQDLRAARHFRVNGQEQGTARSGQELDIEWFPVTDQIEGVYFELRAEGSTELVRMANYGRVQGHHVFLTFVPTAPGRYVLTASGTVMVGVEVCEGFSTCNAPLQLYGSRQVSMPLTLE